jgi:1,2-dihydroxy-3-keto-5-methylthiopentene dioxygenase
VKIYKLETREEITLGELPQLADITFLPNSDLKEVMNLINCGQYSSFDEVIIDQNTPDELLDKFSHEHLHDDDEVRYFLAGNSIFDIRSKDDRWIRIEVSPKDFIALPAGLYHRFIAPEKNIKALRLFSSNAGWTPIYRQAEVFI